jgi:hypothetical protein
MNDGKPGPAYVERTISSREILSIYFRRERVEPSHRIKQVKNRFLRTPPVGFKEKAHNPYPESDKIQVNGNAAGAKGDTFVQRVAHTGNRHTARKQRRPVLEKEKITEDRRNTTHRRFTQSALCNRPDAGEPKRLPRLVPAVVTVFLQGKSSISDNHSFFKVEIN